MAEFYEMPAVSPTMEVGTIVEWKVKEGEAFEPQAVIAEVGTDKANMEAEIFDAGVMLKHLVAEGDEVPPGFPIAIVGKEQGEDFGPLLEQFEQRKAELSAGPPPGSDRPEAPAEPAAEAAETPEEARRQASPPREGPKPDDRERAEHAKGARPPGQVLVRAKGAPQREWMGKTLPPYFQDPPGDIRAAQPQVAASPLARKVAASLGVELEHVQGSGPGGRVVRADVEQAAEQAAKRPAAGPVRADEVIRHSPMRKTIARRMLESTRSMPTFTLTASFDMGGFVALREQVKARLPDVRVSYNDMLVAAIGRALRDYPKANTSWADDAITRHGRVDVGVAVAVPDGLITPVIRDADRKGMAQIGEETRELAGRARKGRLTPEEYTGSTFTISNLGMFDIDRFDAIINPPEAAILAVGSIAQVPVVVDGALTVGWRMNATMTCDHRVIDGAVGAEFLQVLRRYVESPSLMLV